MKCNDYRDIIITDYIDGELTPEKKELVYAHIKDCASCAAFADELKAKAVQPLKSLEMKSPPEQVWHGIKNRIRQEEAAPARRAGWFTFPRIMFASAALPFFIIAIVLYLNRPQIQAPVVSNTQGITASAIETQDSYFSYLYEDIEYTEERDTNIGTAIENLILGRNFLPARVV